MSVKSAVEALPESGLITIKGTSSLGTPSLSNTGDRASLMISAQPLAENIDMAVINKTRVGIMENAVFIPSPAPSEKALAVSFFDTMHPMPKSIRRKGKIKSDIFIFYVSPSAVIILRL